MADPRGDPGHVGNPDGNPDNATPRCPICDWTGSSRKLPDHVSTVHGGQEDNDD